MLHYWNKFEPLKKLFAISFLLIYLFSTTEFSQLLKLPLLIEHFIEHREVNSHLTFRQFLLLHYALSGDQDADQARDMKLPFKSHSNCVASVSNIYLPSQRPLVIKPGFILEKKKINRKKQLYLPAYCSDIWQPPRICWSYLIPVHFNNVICWSHIIYH